MLFLDALSLYCSEILCCHGYYFDMRDVTKVDLNGPLWVNISIGANVSPEASLISSAWPRCHKHDPPRASAGEATGAP